MGKKQFSSALLFFILMTVLIACMHYPGERIEGSDRDEIDYSKNDSIKFSDTILIQQQEKN